MKLWTLSLGLLVVFLLGLPVSHSQDAEGEPESEVQVEPSSPGEPVAEEPSAEVPAAEGPEAEEPAAEEPAAEEPSAEEPSAEEPAAEEPAAEEPVAEEPAAEEPAAEEPGAVEPAAEETDAEEPEAEGPATEEPAAEEPAAGIPSAEEPASEEPVAEEPVAGEPAAEEPVAEEPGAESEVEVEPPPSGEPAAEIPSEEEPGAEEPAVEEPSTEEPVAGEPAAVEPVAEEPAAEEPSAQEPADEEPVVVEPSAEAPAAVEPSAEVPAAEGPTTEPPAVEEGDTEGESETEVEFVPTEEGESEGETSEDGGVPEVPDEDTVPDTATEAEVVVTVEPTEPGPPCESYHTLQDEKRHFSNGKESDDEDFLCDSNLGAGWYTFIHNGEPAIIPTVCIKAHQCGTQLPWRLRLDAGLPEDGMETAGQLCSIDINTILGTTDCCAMSQPTIVRNCSGTYIYYLTGHPKCSISVCTMLPGEEIPYELLGDPPATTTQAPTTETPINEGLPVIDVNDLTDKQMAGTATVEFKYPDDMDENSMAEFDRKFRAMLAAILNQMISQEESVTTEPPKSVTEVEEGADAFPTELVAGGGDSVDSIPNVAAPEPVGPVVPDVDPDAGIKGPLLRRRKAASQDRYTADDVHYVGPTPRSRDDNLQVAVIVDADDEGNVVDQAMLLEALKKLNESGQLSDETGQKVVAIYAGLPEDMSSRGKTGDVWEDYKPLFIVLIVLAIILLIIIIIGLLCIKCRGRGSWGPNKDQDTARIADPKHRPPHVIESPIPDDEITKDEAPMMERENPGRNGHQPISKRDEDNGWVVPIDQLSAAEMGRADVEDTKL